MGSHVIWIGIDPNLLLQGIDPARFFGDKSFLKFNISPTAAKDSKSPKEDTFAASKQTKTFQKESQEVPEEEVLSEQVGEEEKRYREWVRNKEGIRVIRPSERSEKQISQFNNYSRKIKRLAWKYPDIETKPLPKSDAERKANQRQNENYREKEKKRYSTDGYKEVNRERMTSAENMEKTPVTEVFKDAKIVRTMPRRTKSMAVDDKPESNGPDVTIKETERRDEKQMEVCSQNDTSESKHPDLPIEETEKSKKEEMDLGSQDATLEKDGCPKCGKTFPSVLKLREHIETVHEVKMSFQCNDCDKQYAWEKDLKQHTRYKHIGDLRFGCEHCGKILRSNYDLERHVDAIHDLTIYKCENCSEVFKSKEYLRSHEIQNHNENALQCQKCMKKFAEKRNYDQHIEQNNCAKKTSNETLLQMSNDLNALLNETEQKITNEKQSQEKQKVSKKRTIQCWFCQRLFTSKVALNRHTKKQVCQKELREKIEIKCTFENCTKVYETKLGLDRHIMFHNNDRPFQCGDCEKSFIQKVSLQEHVRSHTGEKPFKCGECPAAYRQPGALRTHVRKHETN